MGRAGHCRQHILKSGFEVLYNKGYNAAGVKEITVAAGVPKGSFYNHFDSKEAFVIEAVEMVACEQDTQVEQVLFDSKGTPKQRLLQYFDSTFRSMEEAEFCGGCIVGNLVLEMADENELIRNSLNRIMNKKIQQIKVALIQAKQASELTEETDEAQLAAFIYYAWEGAIMQMKAAKNAEPYQVFRAQVAKFF